jgi:hypothetical protein
MTARKSSQSLTRCCGKAEQKAGSLGGVMSIERVYRTLWRMLERGKICLVTHDDFYSDDVAVTIKHVPFLAMARTSRGRGTGTNGGRTLQSPPAIKAGEAFAPSPAGAARSLKPVNAVEKILVLGQSDLLLGSRLQSHCPRPLSA